MTYQLVYDIETAWPSPIAIVFFVVGLIVTIALLILFRRKPVPDSGIPSGKVVLPFLAVATGFTFVALGMLDGEGRT